MRFNSCFIIPAVYAGAGTDYSGKLSYKSQSKTDYVNLWTPFSVQGDNWDGICADGLKQSPINIERWGAKKFCRCSTKNSETIIRRLFLTLDKVRQLYTSSIGIVFAQLITIVRLHGMLCLMAVSNLCPMITKLKCPADTSRAMRHLTISSFSLKLTFTGATRTQKALNIHWMTSRWITPIR